MDRTECLIIGETDQSKYALDTDSLIILKYVIFSSYNEERCRDIWRKWALAIAALFAYTIHLKPSLCPHTFSSCDKCDRPIGLLEDYMWDRAQSFVSLDETLERNYYVLIFSKRHLKLLTQNEIKLPDLFGVFSPCNSTLQSYIDELFEMMKLIRFNSSNLYSYNVLTYERPLCIDRIVWEWWKNCA